VYAAVKKIKDRPQARYLLALATIYDSGTWNDSAKIGSVSLAYRAGLGRPVTLMA